MEKLKNYIDGKWKESATDKYLDVNNPATGETLGKVPLSTAEEVEKAIDSACEAFQDWRQTPPVERARYLYRLKSLMEENREELAQTITREEGKNIASARGEVRRTIENVEVAAGIPSLMMGYNAEDVAQNIDEFCIKQPLGVFAHLAPFNFPAMVPYWYVPYALATGNTFILKPSEKVPFSQKILMEFCDQIDLPAGVLNLVNGGKEVAEVILESNHVQGVTFVGSTGVARHVYEKAAQTGKKVQCQGGACNFLLVMPDAELEQAMPNIVNSFFACAGQRCLAGQNLVAVGDVYERLRAEVIKYVEDIKVGYGLEEDVDMGPVITAEQRENIIASIDKAVQQGAEVVIDGRELKVAGYEEGNFVGPTVLSGDINQLEIVNEEIFGPVLNLIKVDDLQEGIELINSNNYGNAASIYTQNGKWAREFRYRTDCGNLGVNVGVAAPMPFFPFSGYKDSFFGDLHAQGKDIVNFFTERKVVIERWF
ncbi:MAG: CoA-acylating methylmalonate-semialdehyde dehydrogenase [Halanaerobiales bacterium]